MADQPTAIVRGTCVNHPDRPGAWLLRNGTWECDPCHAVAEARLGEQPAKVPWFMYEKLAAELATARDEIERLHRELGNACATAAVRAGQLQSSRATVDELRDEVVQAVGLAGDYAKERDEARAQLRECREQLDDARDELAVLRARRGPFGVKLCPRCSVEVAAEAAAEKEDQQ